MRRFDRVLSRSLALLIVSALAACDNVQWGGSQIEIVPPPPPASSIAIEPDQQAFAEFGLPRGSVLFHIMRTEDGALLVPVAELSADSLRTLRRPAGVSPQAYETRFRETVLPTGGQFRIFRRGAEVGTFVAQRPGPATACGVPTVYGSATVVAAATDATQFLAFRDGLAPSVRGEFTPLQITGSIRTYAAIVAERLILQNGLPRPRSWVGAQRDLEAIELTGGGHPEMVATYLVGDSLAVGPGDPQGYSVFYMADYETARGYSPVYTEVHDYRSDGKLAPRLVDYLNWDEQEGPEILLEVFRRGDRGYGMLRQRGGRWEKVWESARCDG
ncbi:MAG TPA: hypothetical protein VFZ18_10360 [Longimicrobiaceae bacterium]